jgi:cell division protein FtsL
MSAARLGADYGNFGVCPVTRRLQGSMSSQRGEGRLKAVCYLAILIAAVFVAVKIVPVYVAEYQLKDKITEQARFAVVNRYNDDQIKDSIFHTIQDLDIPAKRDDVKVAPTNHGLVISVNYSVPVDFVVYHTELNFSPSAEGIDRMK